jgi:hypothetical protein
LTKLGTILCSISSTCRTELKPGSGSAGGTLEDPLPHFGTLSVPLWLYLAPFVALFWYQAVGNFETNYGCVSNVYKLRAMSLFVPLVLQVSTVLLPHVALFCPCAYNHESPSPALWSAPQVRNLSRHGEAQAREYCRKRKLSPCACACIFAACYTILSVCLQSRKSIRQLCGPRRRYETYRGTAKHRPGSTVEKEKLSPCACAWGNSDEAQRQPRIPGEYCA